MALFTAEGILRGQVRCVLKGIGPIYSSVMTHAYLRWLATQGIQSPAVATDGWLYEVQGFHEKHMPDPVSTKALISTIGRWGGDAVGHAR